MTETADNSQRKRKVAHPIGGELFRLLISAGLGALIAGFFAVGGDFVRGRLSADEQRCSVAREIVLDESPSPALNPVQRTRLNSLAVRRLEFCMGETT